MIGLQVVMLALALCRPIPAVDYWSAVYGLPVKVANGVLYIESYCDPLAYNPYSGATGYMQILPPTADYISVMTGLDASEILHNPEVNVQAGVWLLALWYHRFHDLDLALASYYGGAGEVIACDCVPDWGRRYVDKVYGVLGWHRGDVCIGERCIMEVDR